MSETIKDFIGVFPNAATKDYCNKVIKFFDYHKRAGRTTNRQEQEKVSPNEKEGEMYFFTNAEANNKLLLENEGILREYFRLVENCYFKYQKKYGFLNNLLEFSQLRQSTCVKVQKYGQSQGYHVWHCDSADMTTARRAIVNILYLNTIEQGGETEFLHQSQRVSPTQGTLIMFPAYWTHPHRGNPTLKGEKLIMTSWLEFMK